MNKKKSLLDCAGLWEDMPDEEWKEFEFRVKEVRKGLNKGFARRIAGLKL